MRTRRSSNRSLLLTLLTAALAALQGAEAFGAGCFLTKQSPLAANLPLIQPQIQSVAADPPSALRSRSVQVKLAILGDQGLGTHPKQVLQLVRSWGANALVQLGDFDYADDPAAFMRQFASVLGQRFPVFAVVGNHDVSQWFTPGTGYRDRLAEHARRSGVLRQCSGEIGVKMVCVFNDVVIVLSGVGTLGADHATFIDGALSAHRHARWKLCVWHKNQANFQTGDKKDETGYDVYETCRRHGAIVLTSHDHTYARSHLMSSFERTEIASTSNTLHVRPGRSFVAVSGLGGDSIRYWKNGRQLNPWWAATAAMDNGANYGALLCTFNVNGVDGHASCKFEDIDGNVWDSFDVVSSSEELNAATVNNSLSLFSSIHESGDAPATRLTDTPIASAGDISKIHVMTGNSKCVSAPFQIEFGAAAIGASDRNDVLPPISDNDRTVHTLTFHIPAPCGCITHAHLQMMAVHPRKPFLDKFSSRSEAYEAFANATDIAMAIWEIPSTPPCLTRKQVLVSKNDFVAASGRRYDRATHQHVLGFTHNSTTQRFPIPSTAVVWKRHDLVREESWESGEVHVSPNIAHLVANAVQRHPNMDRVPVTLVVEGRWWFVNTSVSSKSGSLDEYTRSFYAFDSKLGGCLAPSLVVQTDMTDVSGTCV